MIELFLISTDVWCVETGIGAMRRREAEDPRVMHLLVHTEAIDERASSMLFCG